MRMTALVLGVAAAGCPALAGDRDAALELMADASGRSALIAPAEAGFTVEVHGYMLFRYNWNHRDNESPFLLQNSENKSTVGFEAPFTTLQIGGHLFSEAWTYGVQFRFGELEGGAAVLEDAWGAYAFDGGWSLMWGQFTLPLLREEIVTDNYQLAANRSALDSVFTQDRSQGVQVSIERDRFRLAAAFSDGLSTRNTDFTSPTEADWAVTGRVEWKWAGEWKQAADFTSFPGSPYFGMLGAAAHWQSGGDTFATGLGTTSDTDVFEGTVDVSVEGNGWNLFGAAVYRHSELPSNVIFFGGIPPRDLDDWGFLVQGGVFVSPGWELFARYDVIVPDSDRTSSSVFLPAPDDSFSTVTAGLNRYFIPESHAAKLTVDFQYFLDTQSNSIVPASTLTGLLPSTGDHQWNLRGQMQLMF